MFTLFNQGFLSTLIMHMDSSARFAMLIAGIVLCALIGYLLGSLNFALILSGKMYKDDIRKHGSKNAGTTNMMRTYGNKAAGLTILGDMLKAVVAVLLGALILGLYYGGYAAALGCVVGHVFPVFFGFKGGKGVATAAAAILVLNPLAFLCVLGVFLLCVIFTRYISLGSVLGAAVFPLITFYTCFGNKTIASGSGFAFLCAFIIAVIVIVKFSFKKSKETKK